MRKKILTCVILSVVFILSFAISGCSKTPEKYTDGIKYDRDFPDNIFEIYDDAIVFESRNLFDEIVLTFGTEDDIDDVVDFYHDFFDDNEISLVKEDESRDEYYAHGIFDGYEFKLQVQEADGEYIDDLFEYIVYFSAKELADTQMKVTDSLTPTPEVTPAPSSLPPTTSPTTAKPTPTPTAKPQGKTPLLSVSAGTWTLYGYFEDHVEGNFDATIYFSEDNTGTFYYYDYDDDDRGFYNFTYELNDGVLNLFTTEGVVPYNAYFDDGILHLEHQTLDFDMYFAYWSENFGVYPSDTEFSAYGDWVYYEPETGYIETIAFWPGGSGYVYNWAGTGENHSMNWKFKDGIFTISDETGANYSYGIAHRGEVFELRQLNGSVYFYNRVSDKYWLSGNFYLNETNDITVDDWSFSLFTDNNCEYTLNGEYAVSYWYVDSATGKLTIKIGDSDILFDYHYDVEGLHLWDSYNDLYYDLLQVG